MRICSAVHREDARRFAVPGSGHFTLRLCCGRGISFAMARFLRISLALMLALVVTLTGHASASAQGARDASGQMVICSGTGPVTIYVDEDGQPTKAPHFCPDCVMHLLDAVAGPDAVVLPAYGGQAFDRLLGAVGSSPVMRLAATARAPPRCG
jgi:hypothetical protein